MSKQAMAKTLSFGVSGVNGFPVQVEVFCVDGMPMMEIIGLPDTAVRESKNRIMTGIGRLDKMTGGLSGSKLMIIGARPSVGKTIFAMTICMNAAIARSLLEMLGFLNQPYAKTTKVATRNSPIII